MRLKALRNWFKIQNIISGLSWVPWNVGTIFLELSTNVVFCFWLLLFSRSQALFVKAQNLKYQYIIISTITFLCKNLFEKSVGKIAWKNTCTWILLLGLVPAAVDADLTSGRKCRTITNLRALWPAEVNLFSEKSEEEFARFAQQFSKNYLTFSWRIVKDRKNWVRRTTNNVLHAFRHKINRCPKSGVGIPQTSNTVFDQK